MAVLFLLILPCLAATWRVEKIEERDARGAWTPVDETGEAFVVRSPQEDVPLAIGQELTDDTRIVTLYARVTLIRLDRPDTIQISPESELQIKEWGVIEELGAIWYTVSEGFLVVFHRSEALVEGTQFLVETDRDGAGSVVVTRGKVRVSNPQGGVLVRRGRMARTEPGEPPALRPLRLGRLGRGAQVGGALAELVPRPSLGVLAGGRFSGGGGADIADISTAGGRYTAALELDWPVGPVVLRVASGVETTGHSGDLVPVTVGLDKRLGAFSFGVSGQLVLTAVQGAAPPGEQSQDYTLEAAGGISADLGFRWAVPSSEHLGLQARVKAGVVDGLYTGGATAGAYLVF